MVTGGTGAVGAHLARRLLERGERVRVVARRPPALAKVLPGAEFAVGDVTRPESLDLALDGAGIVFHLAALLHHPNPEPALQAEYQRVNVEGTAIVARATARAGARFVHFSTISVYGPTGEEWLEEASPLRGDGLYALSKRRAEEAAFGHCPSAVVLRVATVYGRRIKGNYHRLVRAIRSGVFVPIGPGTNVRTLIHEDDLAEAAWLVSRHPDSQGQTFNVTDGAVHSVREIIASISSALGRRPPRLHLPVLPILQIAPLVDRLLAVSGRRPELTATLEKYLENVAVSGLKIQALGFRPRYGLEEGWRQALGPALGTG